MKNKFYIMFIILTILLNINLPSYSNEIINLDNKNIYLQVTNNFETISSENKNINTNDWLWSFLFPGLGQIIMHEYLSGITFLVISALSLIVGTFIFVDMITAWDRSRAVSFIPPQIFVAPFALIFLITYIWSAIHAYIVKLEKEITIIKENNKNKEKNKIEADIVWNRSFCNQRL